MDLVRQKIIDGCGVACLAMVTGTDYRQALEVLHPFVCPNDLTASHSTHNEDLIHALKLAGFEVRILIRPDIPTIRDAILVVRYRIGTSMFMHTVVWDAKEQRVLDPYDQRPFEEYESGLCLAFELSRSGPSGPICSAPPV